MHTQEELESYSEEILNIVSKNVIKYRNEKGYSQMKLALEIGMSGGAYLGRAELRKKDHHFNINPKKTVLYGMCEKCSH